jgi:PTH1 family peptidyl-tRNA hydrolase
VRAVVGLGNPGVRYARTRHNLGFRVVERLAEGLKGIWHRAGSAEVSEVGASLEELLLVKPQTYMNGSGSAVSDVCRDYDIALSDLLVVVDDVHLDPGTMRFRRRGSDGGHNGIRSIIESLESRDFARLRLGVGMSPEGVDLIDYVLADFGLDQEEVVEAQLREAVSGVTCWARSGIDTAMNQFNSV